MISLSIYTQLHIDTAIHRYVYVNVCVCVCDRGREEKRVGKTERQ